MSKFLLVVVIINAVTGKMVNFDSEFDSLEACEIAKIEAKEEFSQMGKEDGMDLTVSARCVQKK